MSSSMSMRIPLPAVSLSSMQSRFNSLRKSDAPNFHGSSFWVKCHQYCPLLAPNNARLPAQGGRSTRTARAQAAAPVRWNLDDVERLSRGLPSKAKMGSRAVPHRLNAEERKAFELAKKRGYVVQQANSRLYPLINTYRNYCDALGMPCIRIEQGTAGFADLVVVDFTPLHLSEADLSNRRDEVSKVIASISANQATSSQFVSEVDEARVQVRDQDDSSPLNAQDGSSSIELAAVLLEEATLSDAVGGSSELLRFQVSSRSMTKLISQTALDTWRSSSRSKGGKLTA